MRIIRLVVLTAWRPARRRPTSPPIGPSCSGCTSRPGPRTSASGPTWWSPRSPTPCSISRAGGRRLHAGGDPAAVPPVGRGPAGV